MLVCALVAHTSTDAYPSGRLHCDERRVDRSAPARATELVSGSPKTTFGMVPPRVVDG
jgi:hypothetical protein